MLASNIGTTTETITEITTETTSETTLDAAAAAGIVTTDDVGDEIPDIEM